MLSVCALAGSPDPLAAKSAAGGASADFAPLMAVLMAPGSTEATGTLAVPGAADTAAPAAAGGIVLPVTATILPRAAFGAECMICPPVADVPTADNLTAVASPRSTAPPILVDDPAAGTEQGQSTQDPIARLARTAPGAQQTDSVPALPEAVGKAIPQSTPRVGTGDRGRLTLRLPGKASPDDADPSETDEEPSADEPIAAENGAPTTEPQYLPTWVNIPFATRRPAAAGAAKPDQAGSEATAPIRATPAEPQPTAMPMLAAGATERTPHTLSGLPTTGNAPTPAIAQTPAGPVAAPLPAPPAVQDLRPEATRPAAPIGGGTPADLTSAIGTASSLPRPTLQAAPEPQASAGTEPAAVARPEATAAASTLSPAPVRTILPALQAFGAAMRDALNEKRASRATEPTILAATGAATTTVAVDLTPARQPALDTADRRWPQAMAERIERLRDTVEAAAAETGTTRIRLLPDALGPVDVAVRRDGDRLHVHFAAADDATRQLLADAQPRLAEAADARGFRLGRTEIAGQTTGGDTGRQQQRPAPQPAPRPAPTAFGTAPADAADTRIA